MAEKTMNGLIPNENGIWIECCNKNCQKWRYTLDYQDPLEVPNKWYCDMNSDKSVSDCSIPECLELREGEIFVESRFKAGCIVWAKEIRYPWSVAMVDICPDFECYYWFDNVNTNVPSRYHVTFLAGKRVKRAWVTNKFIKSFAGDEDPSFALKARVCKKQITPSQRAEILEGCKIAKVASGLSLSERLKKYNFNSWKIVQDYQRAFADISKKTSLTIYAASLGNAETSRNGAGPSCIEKQTKKSVMEVEASNSLTKNLEKSTFSKAPKSIVAAKKESVQNTERRRSLRSCGSASINSVNLDNTQSDKSAAVESEATNVEKTNDTLDTDDTRSINSFTSKEFAETLSTKRGFKSVKNKQVVESSAEKSPAVDESTVNRLSDEEIIVDDELDEIIPSSQSSTPSQHYYTNISLKNDEKMNKMRARENFGVDIPSEESVPVLKSPRESSFDKIALKLQSMNQEKRERLNARNQRAASEDLMTEENKENSSEESRYLRALSEFKPKGESPLSDMTNVFQTRNVPARKPLPNWFTNRDERRMAEVKRLDRLSKLSDEDDNKMYKKNRDSFIEEMISGAGPSRGRSELDLERPNYFEQDSYNNLMTSDEDSS